MKKNLVIIVILSFFFNNAQSFAEVVTCKTSINGTSWRLSYDDEDMMTLDNSTFREIFFGGWGEITCPSYITLKHLTPDLTHKERSVFCLKFDEELKTYTGFENGDRDAYSICKEPSKSFCERVNESKDEALAIAGLGAGATGGASVAAGAAGVTAVAHSSGAVILTGTGGYIAGTLGSIGAGSLALLTAPATVAAATVSLVAVGSSVYFCKE